MLRLKRALFAEALFLLVAVGGLRPAAAEFAVRNGDRYVIYGDSITDYKPYARYLENFILTRYPFWHVSIWNYGWGGDRAANVGRFERDCLPMKPTLVTINMGMNDGNYTHFSAASCKVYTDGLTKMCEELKQIGSRVILISPTTYETAVRPTRKAGNADFDMSIYPTTLALFSDAMRGVAKAQGVGFIDLNAAYSGTLAAGQAKFPDFRLSGDAVHPDANGNLIMALHILRGMDAPGDVASLSISAALERVTNASNTRVHNLKFQDKGLSFTRLDEALPFPVDPNGAKYADFIRFQDTLNRNRLSVTGLPAGQYDLLIDDEKIATLSNTELSLGVNLSKFNTPEMRQAQEVAKATDERQAAHYEKWRKVMLAGVRSPGDFKAYDLSSPRLTELDGKIAAAIEKQNKLNKPRPHRYEIRLASAAK